MRPPRAAGLNPPLQDVLGERVARRRVAGLVAAAEPADALLARPVGERVGLDAALPLLLEPIVADRGRRAQALLHVARLEEVPLRGLRRPDAGVAVGLELEA